MLNECSLQPSAMGQLEDVAKIKLLSPNSILPKRATSHAAGYDLYSSAYVKIQPMTCERIPTGIAISAPQGHYGRVAPRSSISLKGIIVNGGVIDADYTGEILIILHNISNEPFEINPGDRVAQLIFEKISSPVFEIVDHLDETERKDGGFGSTNI